MLGEQVVDHALRDGVDRKRLAELEQLRWKRGGIERAHGGDEPRDRDADGLDRLRRRLGAERFHGSHERVGRRRDGRERRRQGVELPAERRHHVDEPGLARHRSDRAGERIGGRHREVLERSQRAHLIFGSMDGSI